MGRTTLTISNMLVACNVSTEAQWSFGSVLTDYIGTWEDREIANFIAQCFHESAGFTQTVENTRYTEATSRRLWGKRIDPNFHFDGVALGEIAVQAMNMAYGGRMGNDKKNDGWLFIGHGIIQLTGRDNFDECAKWIKNNYDNVLRIVDGTSLAILMNTDTPELDVLTAIWYWTQKGCRKIYNENKNLPVEQLCEKLTRKINGGTNGLAHRLELTKKCLETLV